MFAVSDDPDHVLSAKLALEPIAGLHGSGAARRTSGRASGHALSTWEWWTPFGNGRGPSRYVGHASGVFVDIQSSDRPISTHAERSDDHVVDHHFLRQILFPWFLSPTRRPAPPAGAVLERDCGRHRNFLLLLCLGALLLLSASSSQ